MRSILPIERKKKQHDLTKVKIPKLLTLIVRPRCSHKNQIKINYEAQFLTDPMLNDKIKKKNQLNKRHKKQPELTEVNLLSNILGS